MLCHLFAPISGHRTNSNPRTLYPVRKPVAVASEFSQEVASNINGGSFKICLKHRKYKMLLRSPALFAEMLVRFLSGGIKHSICMRRECGLYGTGTVTTRPVSRCCRCGPPSFSFWRNYPTVTCMLLCSQFNFSSAIRHPPSAIPNSKFIQTLAFLPTKSHFQAQSISQFSSPNQLFV